MELKRSVIGILAHVDAGKTTLSEAMLYCTGAIRTLGRVDHADAFLDNFSLERQRGITIFSKQAPLTLPGLQATLLDTPGHVDFSAEMERTLDVLDCAVLVISAPSGVQSHTRTLWKLLRRRNIPTLLFLNKTDLPCPDYNSLLETLNRELGDGFFHYQSPDYEALAMCEESLMEEYLESGTLNVSSITKAVANCQVFPCWFGAALKLNGVEGFLQGLADCAPPSPAKPEFGAKVFKISRDERGARLTHLKVTGGTLRTRDTITGDGWEEKITQLRVLSGSKFTPVDQAFPGDVVAAVGLSQTTIGMGLGVQEDSPAPSLEPVLTYQIFFPEGTDIHKAYLQLQQLEEEDPQLHLVWDPRLRRLSIQLMGPVQMEILSQVILDRFQLEVTFGPGKVLYRETIENIVEGVGHYEPLRHYAEVHLVLEPGERGSGLHFVTNCPEDEFDRNWQRLVLTHLWEKQHLGVLTGSPITDIKITLTAGRAHNKHTEGGDFRQATYRAVRQGLMQAKSVLLEPWYDFRLEIPQSSVGRAITDLQRMGAQFDAPETDGEYSILTGSGPAAAMSDYPQELAAYSGGLGRISCVLKGYAPCAEQEKIVDEIAYDPEADVDNTPDSVFCSHGAGHTVKWRDVFEHMHLPSSLEAPETEATVEERAQRYFSHMASDAELMAIFERTYGPVKDKVKALRPTVKRSDAPSKPYKGKPQPMGPEYVLVDGYNIIFAWEDLRKLAKESLDDARNKLIERLRNYQGWRHCPVIVVFDAYKVKSNPGNVEKHGDLSVVYTKEAETADMYIEKAAYDLSKRHRVRVATSDALEQIIILGGGALRVSASAFEAEVKEVEASIRKFLQF